MKGASRCKLAQLLSQTPVSVSLNGIACSFPKREMVAMRPTGTPSTTTSPGEGRSSITLPFTRNFGQDPTESVPWLSPLKATKRIGACRPTSGQRQFIVTSIAKTVGRLFSSGPRSSCGAWCISQIRVRRRFRDKAGAACRGRRSARCRRRRRRFCRAAERRRDCRRRAPARRIARPGPRRAPGRRACAP